MKLMRLFTIATLTLSTFGLPEVFAQSASTQSAATVPATTKPIVIDGEYAKGVVVEIYSLPRRPRRLRNVLPGLPPKTVMLVPVPKIAGADDVSGIIGNMQAEYSGEILIPTAGEYVFGAESDDGMDISIDGKFVLADAWVNGRKTPSRATVTLAAGWHPVRVRFYQGDGGFNLRLSWKEPDKAELLPIPAEHFRVSAARVAEANAKLNADLAAADAKTPHRAVFRTQGFFELPENEGDLLVDLLEGPTVLSAAARKDLAQTIVATNYDKLTPYNQVKVLSGFLRGWYWEQVARGPVTWRAEYKIADAVAVEYGGWNNKRRQGFRHDVAIDGREYSIFTPAAESPERENVAKTIASLPASLRIMLKTVVVEPYGTANEFNGGGSQIWIRRGGPTPVGMSDNTFSHEIGHLLMNRVDNYLAHEKAIAQDVLCLSHYGRLNPSEDFAEFMRLYLSTEGDAEKIASIHKLFPARSKVLDDALKVVNFQWTTPTSQPSTSPATEPAM